MKTDRQIIEEKGNEYGLAHLTDLMDESKETIIEFIELWLVNRFGRVDRYYREEWLNRFKLRGYCALLFHMDGNSLNEWDRISKDHTIDKIIEAKKGAK